MTTSSVPRRPDPPSARAFRRCSILLAVLALVLQLPAATAEAAPAQAGNPRIVNPPGTHVIMTYSYGMWAGGAARLPGGAWMVTYERRIGGTSPRVYYRTASDLMGSYSPEIWMAGGPKDRVHAGDPAYDPGVAPLKDGTMLITYHNWNGIYGFQRKTNHALTVPAVRAKDGRGTAEASTKSLLGRVLVTYNLRIARGVDEVHVRRVVDPKNWNAPVVAGGPTGSGTGGKEIRATLAATGLGNEVLLVWAKPTQPVGGDRSLWGALSENAGDTWGPPFPIASRSGVDISNPFAVRSGGQLRVYFVQTGGSSSLGLVTSSNHGATWSSPSNVTLPHGVYGIGRPVMLNQGSDLICFCNWVDGHGTWFLGTFKV